MAIDLFSLPKTIFIDVLKKLSPRSFCRLRETCSSMNDFIEENRFIINCHLNPHSLWIRFEHRNARYPESYEFYVFVMNHPVKWRYPKALYDVAECPSPYPNVYLSKPYSQLSAMSFSAIVLEYNFFERRPWKTHKVFVDLMVPFLQQLRFRCEWLCLANMPAHDVCSFLPLIRFSNICCNFCNTTVSELEKWPMKHCKELTLNEMYDAPKTLESLADREVLCMTFREPGEATLVLTEFLQEITLREERYRKLKLLRLTSLYEENPLELTENHSEIEFLCSFQTHYVHVVGSTPKKRPPILDIRAYRLVLKERVVYIFQGTFLFEIYLLRKTNTRHELFSAITSFIFQHKTPQQSHLTFYEAFLDAETNEDAIRQYAQEIYDKRLNL